MTWLDIILAELESALEHAATEAESGVPRESLDAWIRCW